MQGLQERLCGEQGGTGTCSSLAKRCKDGVIALLWRNPEPGKNIKQEWQDQGKSVCSQVLHHRRRDVEVRISMHEVRMVSDGVQIRLTLKFTYPKELITDTFGFDSNPVAEQRFVKHYSGRRQIIPYIVLNAVEEQFISWSYTLDREGTTVTERIETMTTLAYRSYVKYYPFELKLLPLKVVLDTTAGSCADVNLLPMDFNPGVFTRQMSPLSIGGDDEKAFSRVVYGMFARSKGDVPVLAGWSRKPSKKSHTELIGTGVNVIFFFESEATEELLKYIGVSTLLMLTTTFLPVMEIGDLIQTGLACTFASVALLFVIPENDTFTLTEMIIVFQVLYQLLLTLAIGWAKDHDWPSYLGFQPFEPDQKGAHVLVLNVIAVAVTVAAVLLGRYEYWCLVNNIMGHLQWHPEETLRHHWPAARTPRTANYEDIPIHWQRAVDDFI